MRWIDATDRGVWAAFLGVSTAAAAGSLFGPELNPSEEALRATAGIGASFFLGFIVEATWLAGRVRLRPSGEKLLGILTGLALAGLIGVALALAASDHQPGDRTGMIGGFGIWWSFISVGCLGFMVAMQPLLAHSWQDEND